MKVSLFLLWVTATVCASTRVATRIPHAPRKSATKVLAVRGGSVNELSSMDWRYFAAGDVVKTCMQTNPEKYSKGVLQAAKDIVQQEGVGYLLAGLGPTVVGYGFEGALKFGFYEAFKVIFAGLTQHQFVNYLMASVIAGAIASVVLCPMEEARIKMVGDASWARENVVSSIVRLIREDGLFSSFSGLPAMLSKQIPYTMGKQVSFDLIAQLLYAAAAYASVSKADAKWAISLGAAFLASVVACLSSQPGDMILTATYKGAGHGHGGHSAAHSVETDGKEANSKDFGAVVGGIYRQHGLAGFYLGLQARLAHVASIITSQLVVYDLIKMALGLPVTGSH